MKLVKSLLAVLLVLTVTQIGDVQTRACDSYADEKFGPVCPFDCSNCGAVTCRDSDYVCVTGYCPSVNGPAGPQGCAFEDIARGKNMAHISTFNDLGPYRATNRIYATNEHATCTHTDPGVSYPWWRVDFGGQHVVYGVQLYNRITNGIPVLDRLSYFDVRVGNTDIQAAITAGQKFNGNPLCKNYNQRVPESLSATVKPYAEILCDQPRRGRYLSLQMNEGIGISRSSNYKNVLTICEISIRGYKDFGSGGRTGNGDCWCRDGNECDMAGVCDSGCKLGRYGKYCHTVIALETPTLSVYSPTTVKVQWKLFNSNQLTLIDSNRGSVSLSYRVQYKSGSGAWQDFPGQSGIIGSGSNQFRALTLTGLQADAQYQIRYVLVKTYNGNPEMVARSSAVTRCAVPTPVTDLQLTSSCDGADRASITVTWQASSYVRCGTGSVQYVVWLKEGSGTFGTHNVQSSGYVIRPVRQATLYTVRVEARNSAYPGLRSLFDETLTTTDGAPSSPENVKLSTSYSTAIGTWPNQARIAVTWRRPENVGCGTPKYRVTYGPVGTTGETIYGLDATSHTLLDLVPYTEYEVTVTTSSGGVTASAATQTIITAEGQSSPVTDIQFSATSTTSTTVSWSKPTMPYGIITKYLVTYRRLRYLVSGPPTVNCPAGSVQAKTVTVTSGTSVQLTGLKSNARYNVAVVPYTNGGGRAGMGRNVNVDTLSAALPKPSQIRASPLYDGTLPHPNQCKAAVNWAADIGDDCMVLQFRVNYTPTSGQTVSSAVLSGVTRSLIISSLKCYTDYEVRVVALSGSAESESEPYDFKTPEGKPGPVSSFTITPSSNSAVLSWSAPTPHGVLSQYQITYRRVRYLAGCPSNDQTKTRTVSAGTTTFTVTGLSSYSEYQFSVTAYTNNNQNKGLTTWQTKQTTTKAPPSPTITEIQSQYVPTYTYPNTAKITVEWSQPAPGITECMTITNHVYYRQPGTVLTSIDAGMNSRAYDIPNLIPYTNYEARIEARSGQGVSSFTGWKMHRTANGLSGPVTSLSVSPSGTTVDVSWAAPIHPYGVITSYRVSYSRQSYLTGCTNNPGHAGTEEYVDPDYHTISGLSPSSRYQVRVAAINGAGPGKESSRAVNTLDTVPDSSAAPTKAIVLDAQTTSATVRFHDISCKQQRGSFKAYNYQLTDLSYGVSSRSGDVSTPQPSLTGLTPFTSYNIRYNWANQKGASAWSEQVEFVTEKSAPPAPTITTVDSGPRYINVTVEPPYPPYDHLTSVTVTCRRTDNNQEITNQITVTDSSKEPVVVPFDEVQPSTDYFCSAVVTGSLSVTSSKSDEVLVSTTESEASQPREFRALEITTSSMRLIWITPEAKNGLIMRYQYWCQAEHTKNPSMREFVLRAPKLESALDHRYTTNDGVLAHVTDPITGLWSATQYECHVWAVNGWGPGRITSQTFWTEAESISISDIVLNYDAGKSNDDSVFIELPEIRSPNVEIELYQILVQLVPQTDEPSRRKRSADPGLTFEEAQVSGLNVYTAAEWYDSRESFRVGDGQNYSDYYNAPLVKGETYNISYGVSGVVDNKVDYAYVSLSKPVKVGYYPEPVPVGVIAGSMVGAVLFLILVLGVVIGVFVVLPRFRRQKPGTELARNDDAFEMDEGATNDGAEYAEVRELSSAGPGTVPPVKRYAGSGRGYDPQALLQIVQELTYRPRGFTEEFMGFRVDEFSRKVATRHENDRKNQKDGVLPYDHSRVKLGDDVTKHDDVTDYVNASWIQDFEGQRSYISAQAPMKNRTEADFWKLIWEKDVKVIVMLSAQEAGGEDLGALYWPSQAGAAMVSAGIQVALQTEKQLDWGIIRRDLVLINGGVLRNITQLQYAGWPDQGVPALCAPLLKLRAAVREAAQPDSLTLVHCSYGSGRTGAFIAVDDVLCQHREMGTFNVKDTIQRLLHCRDRMIETDRQFTFVHHCLLESLLLGDTSILKSELLLKLQGKESSSLEYKVMDLMRQARFENKSIGSAKPNQNKNRNPDIIPDDLHRPTLLTQRRENCYINACFVKNLSGSPELLVTQLPLANTVTDLWQLVWDQEINTIVRLDTNKRRMKPGEQYWPTQDRTVTGAFTITFDRCDSTNPAYTVETFKLSKGTSTPRAVSILVFQAWPDNSPVPEFPLSFLHLYKALKTHAADAPTALVQCYDGATKSGLLCATYCLLEELSEKESVSIYQAVRQTQHTRPQFIPDMKQYAFLHAVACEFMELAADEIYSTYMEPTYIQKPDDYINSSLA